MPQYLCLLYNEEVDEATAAERWAEIPEWKALTDALREADVLVANGALHAVQSATTVRVRNREAELTDGPFATTKEVLAGFYLLECADLDEALRHAERFPTARYGSVEVRPVMDAAAMQAAAGAA
jgi:hypothetical protein